MTSLTDRPHIPLAIAGAALVSLTSIVGSGFNPLSIPFALWSLLPYGVLWMTGRVLADPWVSLGAGTAALAAELGLRGAVFIWPRGSTAAIALVFSPFYIACIVMPVGAAAGWLFGMLWRAHAAGRIAVIVASPILLGLLTLGLARPDLFPTTVARRRALLERIGQPRVVMGGERFESMLASSKTAWHLAGEFDGMPGQEIAVVDHAGADLLDSTTLETKSRVDFGGPPGRLWGSFSTLVRLPTGRLAVAQTGGGFSRTLLQDLDGAELWEYQADPTLPPDAMRPADLDGDGETEFYGSSTDAMVRLDPGGREVWRRPTKMAALLATLPRAGNTPAWVVGVEYGRKVSVWDADGRPLAERAVTAGESPLTAIDSFAGRSFIHGGSTARAVDLQGAPLFEVALGDFTLSQALGVRLQQEEGPSVLLLASTDRDTSRYRLLVMGPDRQPRYDEILDRYPRVSIARRADGTDALLIGDAQGLRVLTYRSGAR